MPVDCADIDRKYMDTMKGVTCNNGSWLESNQGRCSSMVWILSTESADAAQSYTSLPQTTAIQDLLFSFYSM